MGSPRLIVGKLTDAQGDIILAPEDAEYLWRLAAFGRSPKRDGRLEGSFGTLSPFEAYHILANPARYATNFTLQVQYQSVPLDPHQLLESIRSPSDQQAAAAAAAAASYLQCIVYDELRGRGWIVQSGLNYGVDFLLYRKSPEVEHAPFAVLVRAKGDRITWQDAVAFGRVAATARKQLVIAFVDGAHHACRYLKVSRWIPEATDTSSGRQDDIPDAGDKEGPL